VEETRERILSAAWQVARELGTVQFSLAEIAALAGVSRQALYLHFTNRSGLLLEMARRIDYTSGFVDRLAVARKLEPLPAFRRLLRLWFEHLDQVLPVARALEAAAITGEEGAEAYHDRMLAWHETLHIFIAALAGAQLLRREWTVDQATDWVWARTQPAIYDSLTRQRGWTTRTVTQRSIRSIIRELTDA
jgi:AcrR family transcriptional regulator